jgi:Zn-dependent protease with chaperone function
VNLILQVFAVIALVSVSGTADRALFGNDSLPASAVWWSLLGAAALAGAYAAIAASDRWRFKLVYYRPDPNADLLARAGFSPITIYGPYLFFFATLLFARWAATVPLATWSVPVAVHGWIVKVTGWGASWGVSPTEPWHVWEMLTCAPLFVVLLVLRSHHEWSIQRILRPVPPFRKVALLLLRIALTVGITYLSIPALLEAAARSGSGYAEAINLFPSLYILSLAVAVAVMYVLFPVVARFGMGCKPLPHGELRTRLLGAGERAKVWFREILVMPLGPMRMPTAMVTGLWWRLRYVFLTEPLLKVLNDEEIEAVFSHEASHIRHRHIVYLFVAMLTLTIAAITLSDSAGRAFGSPESAEYVAIGVWGVIMLSALFIAIPRISRRFEEEADAGAFELMGSGRPLASALHRISTVMGVREKGGGALHPPVSARIAAAQAYDLFPAAISGKAHAASRMAKALIVVVAVVATVASAPAVAADVGVGMAISELRDQPLGVAIERIDVLYRDHPGDQRVSWFDAEIGLNLAQLGYLKDAEVHLARTRAVWDAIAGAAPMNRSIAAWAKAAEHMRATQPDPALILAALERATQPGTPPWLAMAMNLRIAQIERDLGRPLSAMTHEAKARELAGIALSQPSEKGSAERPALDLKSGGWTEYGALSVTRTPHTPVH